MTTITPDRLEELAELEREAWTDYRESLRDLQGRDYEVTEAASWDDLQRTLAEVAAERGELEPAT
jgi:capsid protein